MLSTGALGIIEEEFGDGQASRRGFGTKDRSTTYQTSMPSASTYHSSMPSASMYHSSMPSATTYHSSMPSATTYHSSMPSPSSSSIVSGNVPVIRIADDHDDSFNSSDPEQISLTSFGSPEPLDPRGASYYQYERGTPGGFSQRYEKQSPSGSYYHQERHYGGGGAGGGGSGGGGGGGNYVRREERRTVQNGPMYISDPYDQRSFYSSLPGSRPIPAQTAASFERFATQPQPRVQQSRVQQSRVQHVSRPQRHSPQHTRVQRNGNFDLQGAPGYFPDDTDFAYDIEGPERRRDVRTESVGPSNVRSTDFAYDIEGPERRRDVHTESVGPSNVRRTSSSASAPGGDRRFDTRYSHPEKERKFLRDVQDELDEKREEWRDEVDRMTGFGLSATLGRDGKPAGQKNSTNSFVDTTTGHPIFKAFVDVHDYPPNGINVTVDKISNKIIVTAKKDPVPGAVSQSFTQKVQLPRFADDQRVRSKLSREGVLTVEVPLIYYFEPEKKKAKSFINQVKTDRNGRQIIEILVNVGSGFKAWELKVQVIEDKELRITGVKEDDNPDMRKKKTIKRYNLPPNADPSGITSRLGDDGRLIVSVPLIGSRSPQRSSNQRQRQEYYETQTM